MKFSHVSYRNVNYFLYFSYTLFFSSALSKRELFFAFIMYTIEAWSSICFFHLYCRNVNYCLFFSCPLLKLQVLLVFLMYTIKTWSILFVFLMYTIVTWSVLVFLIYTIEISSPFCFSHVHYWIVECFLFFSCTLSECQFLFFFYLMYTI